MRGRTRLGVGGRGTLTLAPLTVRANLGTVRVLDCVLRVGRLVGHDDFARGLQLLAEAFVHKELAGFGAGRLLDGELCWLDDLHVVVAAPRVEYLLRGAQWTEVRRVHALLLALVGGRVLDGTLGVPPLVFHEDETERAVGLAVLADGVGGGPRGRGSGLGGRFGGHWW